MLNHGCPSQSFERGCFGQDVNTLLTGLSWMLIYHSSSIRQNLHFTQHKLINALKFMLSKPSNVSSDIAELKPSYSREKF